MAKRKYDELTSLIEALASRLVMWDSSPEDITEFIQALKKVQTIGGKKLAKVFDVIFKAIDVIRKTDEGKIADVFQASVSYLQYAAAQLQRNGDPLKEVKSFVDQLDVLLGLKGPSARELSSVQNKEIPAFVSDTSARLEDMEADLLALEQCPHDEEKINAVFRAFHTIKGESNLLGLINLGGLAHETESLLENVRQGKIDIDSEIITALLGTLDDIREILKTVAVDVAQALSLDVASFKEKVVLLLRKKLDAKAKGPEACPLTEEGPKDDSSVISPPPGVPSSSEPPPAAKPLQDIPPAASSKEQNIPPETIVPAVPPAGPQEDSVTSPTGSSSPAPVAKPGGKGSFTPKIPELDLSEGPEIIVEFIAEAFEHLSNAEGAILVLETNPQDKEAIDSVFRAFHTIKGVSGFLNLDDIRILSHEAETMLDRVRSGILSFQGTVADLTFVSIDGLRTLLALLKEQVANNGVLKSPYFDAGEVIHSIKLALEGHPTGRAQPRNEPLGEILVGRENITGEELEQALDKQRSSDSDKKIGEILVSEGAASQKEVSQGLAVQSGSLIDNAIKISVEKLDLLYDLVGELVIGEEQVVQNPLLSTSEDQRLTKNISQLNTITRRLQDISMSMRLVPVRPIFQKMNRLIRDLSKKFGKDITVTLTGEDTEIDKNMVDLVSDPMIHMVRNAIDHGIEYPQDRVAKGKPAQGRIDLRAFHKAGNVVIEIRDDGGGLHREKILAKAKQCGLVKDSEHLSDNRIYNLIFEPGFSTAEKITDVSGRGVGMDVVKRNIERLRGKVEISSKQDEGSIFGIHLPITLAIIDGIVLAVGVERYILPIISVVEFIQPREKDITQVTQNRQMIKIQGNLYPVIRLGDLWGVKEDSSGIEEMTGCLVESEEDRVCLIVDRLLGQQQVVIKSLGERLKDVRGLAGATILGDGRVGLILDVNGIVELFRG